MITGPRYLLLLPLAALLGCGSSSSPTTTASTAYDFNGTWSATYSSSAQPASMPFIYLNGPLQVSSSGAVTGTLTATDATLSTNLCSANNVPITVTGTLDAAHNLDLTFPIAGGTGTLLATLADDPTTYAYGSWQVNGGSCAMSVTAMAIKGTPTTAYTPSSAPVSSTANLSGNWAAAINENVTTPHPIVGFAGALQFSNGAVSGTLTALPQNPAIVCQGSLGSGIATASGTFDSSSNSLTLTMPVAGGTATINVTLGANPQTLADGTFRIDGGACEMTTADMTIAQYTPLTGAYTGTFNIPNVPSAGSTANWNSPVANTNITVTAVLTQSATVNSSGQYPVTGTINVTGACTDSITITGATVVGSSFSTPSTQTNPAFSGTFDPTASAIYNASYSSSNCLAHLEGTGPPPPQNAVPYQGILALP